MDSRSARAPPRSPAPIPTEGSPMPTYDGVRLHNHEHLFPAGPEMTQSDPEQAVVGLQARPRVLSLEDGDLLTKSQNLKGEIGARTKKSTQCHQECEGEI